VAGSLEPSTEEFASKDGKYGLTLIVTGDADRDDAAAKSAASLLAMLAPVDEPERARRAEVVVQLEQWSTRVRPTPPTLVAAPRLGVFAPARGTSRERRPRSRHLAAVGGSRDGPRRRSSDDEGDLALQELLGLLIRLAEGHPGERLLTAHVRSLARRHWQVSA
jgi:hypothetical protein